MSEPTWHDALRALDRLLVEKTGRQPAIVRMEVTHEAWQELCRSEGALFREDVPAVFIRTYAGSVVEVRRAAQATAPAPRSDPFR